MAPLPRQAYFLIKWTLGTTLGPFVGFSFLLGYLEINTDLWTTILPLSLLLLGLLLGIGQWFVLRAYLDKVCAWIPLTTIGLLAGIMLGLSMGSRFDAGDWIPSIPLAVGTVLGIFQWPVLAREFDRSILWIPTSILSWTFGLGLVLAVFSAFTTHRTGSFSLGFGMGLGLVCGLITGSLSGIFLASNISLATEVE